MNSSDLNLIAESCGIFNNNDVESVVENINNLQNNYNEGELVHIYNYFLKVSTNPMIMMNIIKCLDKFRHPSSLEFLVDTLLLKDMKGDNQTVNEQYLNVRVMCAKAIANQKNTDVVSSLLYCLNNKNENYRVRLACAEALGRIGDKYAVAPLIDVVKDEEEKSVYLRESALSALVLLGDTRAVDPILGIIEAKQGLLNKFTFLKERAIEALIKMGFLDNERVFRALKSSLSDESVQVRINAIEAIMESGHKKAYDVIKRVLMNDTDIEVKKNAMIALYNLSDRSILDEVISTDSYCDELKLEAVSLLNEYENDEKEDCDD